MEACADGQQVAIPRGSLGVVVFLEVESIELPAQIGRQGGVQVDHAEAEIVLRLVERDLIVDGRSCVGGFASNRRDMHQRELQVVRRRPDRPRAIERSQDATIIGTRNQPACADVDREPAERDVKFCAVCKEILGPPGEVELRRLQRVDLGGRAARLVSGDEAGIEQFAAKSQLAEVDFSPNLCLEAKELVVFRSPGHERIGQGLITGTDMALDANVFR